MNYLRQVQRGVDFIEAHLEEDIDLATVSRAAGVSHWHFQRMFKALTRETLKSYVRSRRLANARIALLKPGARIIDVALGAGFDSQASFTRAFKKAFGIPPAQYRDLGDKHLYLEKIRIDEDYLRHVHENVSLEPEISHSPERYMVGLQTNIYGVDSERNNIGEKLPPLWAEFVPRVEEIPSSIRGICYGVVSQAEPDQERLEYTAAMEVQHALTNTSAVPKDMVCVRIPESTYATFTHVGDPVRIDQTVNYIYSTWLMSSRWRHTYGPDIEVYDDRWAAGSEDSIMGYSIPIVAA